MKTLARRNALSLDVRDRLAEPNRPVDEIDSLLDRAFDSFARPGVLAGAFTPLADVRG
jgi:hypothetical protein